MKSSLDRTMILPLMLVVVIGIRFCECQNEYETCRQPFECGTLRNLGYPFHGGSRPSTCGYPGFDLACDNGVPLINISSSIVVRLLDYDNQTRTIRVARNDLWTTPCAQILSNVSFDAARFNFYSPANDREIFLLYGCPRILLPNQFDCGSGGLGLYFTRELNDAGSTCTGARITVRISETAAAALEATTPTISFLASLQSGFSIQWSAEDDKCDACVQSGGACGSDGGSGSFACYCVGGAVESTCRTPTSPNQNVDLMRGKKPLSQKRKGEATSSPSGQKKQATESSEQTRSGIPTPRGRGHTSVGAEEFDAAAVGKLVMGSASSEPDLAITDVRTSAPVFPAGVDPTLEEYDRVSSAVRSLLKGSVGKYHRILEKNKVLAHDKAKISKALAEATAREAALQEQVDRLSTELNATKEKVAKSEEEAAAARVRESEIAAAQGDVFHALAERITFSKGFGKLVSSLSKTIEKRAVAEVLDRVAAKYPDLDKGEFGYEPVEDEEVLRIYFRKILKKASPFPVVGYLAEGQALLTAADIQACQFDRDADFEEACIPFREELATCPLSPDTPPPVLEGEGLEEADADARTDNTTADTTGGVS